MNEIHVSVRFFNVLASYSGTRRLGLSLPDSANLHQALDEIVKMGTPELQAAMMQTNRFSKYLRVFVNQKLITDSDYEIPLHDGDELMIYPAIAGG